MEPVAPVAVSLADPQLYINRELSWLEFNQRVLDQALDDSVPLFERMKFLAITASNLDEFFMVRVAGVKTQLAGGVADAGPDGLSPAEQLARISARTHAMVAEMQRCLREQLLPGLANYAGIELVRPTKMTAVQRKHLAALFADQIFPILTPMAIDLGHPFPHLRNKTTNLAVTLVREGAKAASLAVIQVPGMLASLVELPPSPTGPRRSFALLADVIALHAGEMFPGARVLAAFGFRVTRNFDLAIDEEESADLLATIQKEVRRRDRGNAVRLELEAGVGADVRRFLAEALKLGDDDLYEVDVPHAIGDLLPLCVPAAPVASGMEETTAVGPRLADEPFTPQVQPRLRDAETLFSEIAKGDVLLHHPYESFATVIDFIEDAAEDPNVLAIKQTLYRTSGDSPIVKALALAAERGKQVTALIEIKARFDEEANIHWARALEEAGVHVVYGLIGLKTHCKVAMVVRREKDGLRRYVHFGTGNYNPATARLYTDLSLLTCRPQLGTDASNLFNLLTGYSQPPVWHRLVVAPLTLQERIIELIRAEAKLARSGKEGRIIAKMNALVDAETIRELYEASRAGVKIDLLVRGICGLRPGVPGVSDNIRVISVVDRFLEHSRIFYFRAGGKEEVFISSADWMPRNFVRRVEAMIPIEDPALRTRVVAEILGTMLADNVKANLLRPDGSYVRLRPGDAEPQLRSQVRFLEIARAHAEAAPLATMQLRARTPVSLRPSPRRGRVNTTPPEREVVPVVVAPAPEPAPAQQTLPTRTASPLPER
ncbi:MAG: polyphosphate kinase 1 [Deltaproteobacteria bacterium]|nr:polyphosphate kinase 1 [Deltaproteobacteria bacterium]